MCIRDRGKGIEEPFVTFKQDLRYLRKQLNTDPNGKIEMNLGKQTAKVALASLIIDRANYIDSLTGETISGSQILDNIMAVSYTHLIRERPYAEIANLKAQNESMKTYQKYRAEAMRNGTYDPCLLYTSNVSKYQLVIMISTAIM